MALPVHSTRTSRRMIRHAVPLVLLVAASAAPLAAQGEPPPNALQPGAQSLTFGFHSTGETSLGYWRMVRGSTALGLDLDAGVERQEARSHGGEESEGRQSSVVVRPAARFYLSTDRAVVPFLHVGLSMGSRRVAAEPTPGLSATARARSGGARAGAGFEWFPVRDVSLLGFGGIEATAERATTTYEAPGIRETGTSRSWRASTFRTGLTVSIHLRPRGADPASGE